MADLAGALGLPGRAGQPAGRGCRCPHPGATAAALVQRGPCAHQKAQQQHFKKNTGVYLSIKDKVQRRQSRPRGVRSCLSALSRWGFQVPSRLQINQQAEGTAGHSSQRSDCVAWNTGAQLHPASGVGTPDTSQVPGHNAGLHHNCSALEGSLPCVPLLPASLTEPHRTEVTIPSGPPLPPMACPGPLDARPPKSKLHSFLLGKRQSQIFSRAPGGAKVSCISGTLSPVS